MSKHLHPVTVVVEHKPVDCLALRLLSLPLLQENLESLDQVGLVLQLARLEDGGVVRWLGEIYPCDIYPYDIYPWRHLPIGDIYP